MVKKLTIIMIFPAVFLICQSLFAGWEEGNSPVSEKLNDVAISNPFDDDLFAVGENQTILTSSDKGINWQQISFEGTNDFTAVHFFTASLGYIGGTSGELLRTINGGMSWSERDAKTDGKQINAISFISTKYGIIGANDGYISFDTSAGLNWYKHSQPVLSSDINDISMVNSGLAYAAGESGIVLKSTDNGKNWSVLQQSDKSYSINALDFKDANTGCFVTNTGSVYKTTDGGNNWTVVHTDANKPLNDVIHAGNNRFFAVGNGGKIIISNDNGSNWLNQTSLVTVDLNAITAVSANILSAVGDNGKTIYTTDAGGLDTWSLNITEPQPGSQWIAGRTYKIKWQSNNINNIKIYYSSDSGNNWTFIKNISAAAGETNWDISAGLESDQCRIKLEDADNEARTAESQDFEVVQNLISITSPQDGETYKNGSEIDITWETNLTTTFEIYYSNSGGAPWVLIDEKSSSSGIYTWTAPAEYSRNYSIRLVDKNDNLNYAEMDGDFTLYNLEITSPVENDTLLTGRMNKIEWNTNINDELTLYYSGGDSIWQNITDVLGSNNEYDWIIPSETTEGNYSIKAEIKSVPEANEISDEFFVEHRILALEKPDSADVWNTFETNLIKWNADFETDLGIYYSIDGMNNWNFIADVSSKDMQYEWSNIPDVSTDEFFVKLEDKNDPLTFTMNEYPAYLNNKKVELRSPNGGERFNIGDVIEIEWETLNVSHITLEFSFNNGTDWQQYNGMTGIDALSTNKINWQVPEEPSESCLIRAFDAGSNVAADTSDEVFSIMGIRLDNFDGGEQVLTGSSEKIEWSSNAVNLVDIYFSSDAGTNWNLIEQQADAESGSYMWTVPNEISTTYKIKLLDPENSLYQDISAANFAVNGLKITSPDGGEVWQAGTQHDIKWQTNENSGKVKLEYTTNQGENWITIDAFTDISDKSYEWKIPKTNSNRCRVKITKAEDEDNYALSNEFFTIDGNGIVVLSPDSNSVWETGNTYSINWAKANVRAVDVYISQNNGLDWVLLDNENTGTSFSWTLPGSLDGSVENIIKLVDTDNNDIHALSDKFKIDNGTYYNVPVSWNYRSHTGFNATVIVPENVGEDIEGTNMNQGDAVGFFYESNGGLSCAGYNKWTSNQNLGVTVWGNDPQSLKKDGFNYDEAYQLKYWDSRQGKEYMLYARYRNDSGGYFYTDKISYINKLSVYTTLEIPLEANKWHLISSNKVPSDVSVKSITSGILESFGSKGYMKDEDGRLFYPEENIDNIGNWDFGEGYQIYVMQDDTLRINGYKADPNVYKKWLQARKWYIISYLPQYPMPVSTALNSVNHYIILVKNSAGEIYYPDYSINQIGDMQPGEGYKISLDHRDSLIYPASSTIIPGIKTPELLADNSYENNHFPNINLKTGNSGVYIIKHNKAADGDEAALLTKDGVFIGTSVFRDSEAIITAWGDNTLSPDTEGAMEGEPLELRIWSKNNNTEKIANINSITDKFSETEINTGLVYNQDAIYEVKADVVNSVTSSIAKVSHAPVPADDKLRIDLSEDTSFNLIKIYGIGGELLCTKVISTSERVHLDLTGYSSGVYYYVLSNGKESITNKFIVE